MGEAGGERGRAAPSSAKLLRMTACMSFPRGHSHRFDTAMQNASHAMGRCASTARAPSFTTRSKSSDSAASTIVSAPAPNSERTIAVGENARGVHPPRRLRVTGPPRRCGCAAREPLASSPNQTVPFSRRTAQATLR